MKNYVIQFGGGNPSAFTGLSPTFTVFNVVPGGGATTPPGITEIPTATGLYYFSYAPQSALAFVIDGGAAITNPAERYISNVLDPVQAVDESISSLGATLFNTIGSTASSFGGTATEAGSLYGYLKRLQEFNEGNSVFTKSSGAWDIFARGNAVGASTQIIQKVLTDSATNVTKV